MELAFHSLFLPLAAEEQAVFADVFPLLLTSTAAVQDAAAAAAGERVSRPPASTTSSGFSPVESGQRPHYPREPAAAGDTSPPRDGAPTRSLVFAIGSARADALAVVLRRGHVVVYGLDRLSSPPYERYRICPLPTTQQLVAAREKVRRRRHTDSAGASAAERVADADHRQQSSSSSSSGGGDGVEVCCAALLPLHISFCCRVPIAASSSGAAANVDDDAAVFLRGVVGSSDGRVGLFSDTAYTLSFAAHETPVAQVDAVLLPPCTLEAEGPPTSAAAQRHERLARATQRLGLVTSGSDGVVLLWRRLRDVMCPVVVVRPSTFSRHVAYTVHHPSALSAMLSAGAPLSRRGAAIDAELACPPSSLLHATTSGGRALRLRQLASLAPNPTHAPSSPTAAAAAAAAAAAVHRESIEAAAPTSMSVAMPGSWPATATALATHHGVTLVALGASLFALVQLSARSATRVWKAGDTITQIVLRDTVALAVCARSGTVHVLITHPGTGQVLGHRVYYSYKNRAIRHVSLHEASLLMTIVDVCGSTELVQLPADVLLRGDLCPLGVEYRGGCAAEQQLLASMAALCAKVRMEDVKGGGGGGETRGVAVVDGASSMYAANAALDHLNEELLLARYAVPEDCNEFMAAGTHIF
ncbi:hypothetical protein NESM_000592200 [Novymonas esmeraldas]|uniref:Uncharacterized protein n=1 Tax=Novymonas esmeraldas TaxID=1808958 RepID=A0AAW0ETF8_9TRYP